MIRHNAVILSTTDVAIRDTILYVTDEPGRLLTFSVADPGHLRLLSQAPGSHYGWIALSDSLLAVGGQSSPDLSVFSLVDPGRPSEIGRRNLESGIPHPPLLQHDTLYLCTCRGLYLYRIDRIPGGIAQEPTRGRQIRGFRIWPSVAQAMLYLDGTEQAVLRDVAGRRVATLHNGMNDVRRFAPGVYYVCPTPGLSSPAQKLVITR